MRSWLLAFLASSKVPYELLALVFSEILYVVFSSLLELTIYYYYFATVN